VYQVALIGDSPASENALRRQLAGVAEVAFCALENALKSPLVKSSVLDIDLENDQSIVRVKDWLKRKSANAKAIFITDKASHLQNTRAYGIGATDVVHRPVQARAVLAKLWGEVSGFAVGPPNETIAKSPAVSSAVDTLQTIFSAACSGEAPDASAINSSGDAVVGHVETQGLTAWIDTVRTHHSLTYQHCLLVTGLAVAFGQRIGVSRADRRRLSIAGMLHDIGKARIPLAILEKPARLDDEEMAVMKKHPQYGFDALATVPDLPAEMLDMVVHHHEYLDGSGYPHGLAGTEIADLVRIITIADVFGALIERRAYKPPMPNRAAYNMLLEMGPKLDADLVREFRAVAQMDDSKAAAVA